MLKFITILCFFLLASCASSSPDKTDRANLHQRIGLSYYETGNYPLALKEFKTAYELDPKNPAILNNLGLVYFHRERYDLAEQHVRKALAMNSEYTDARNNLARILIELKKYDEAEKELKLVIDDLTYTGIDRGYMNLGLLYFNQGEFQKARESFLKTVGLQKESCTANTYLGKSHFELKNYPKAAEILDNAIGFCQTSAYDEPHYYSALTYYRLGETEKSLARFEEILKLYPNGVFRDKSRAMLDLIKKDLR
jgi:type IV pilus assembly protein PilF